MNTMVTFKTTTKFKTPTLDKMTEVHERSNAIGNFLEWIQHSREPRLFICEIDEDSEQYYPTFPSIEKLLAEFFEIDLDKAEKERRELLDYVRQQNEK